MAFDPEAEPQIERTALPTEHFLVTIYHQPQVPCFATQLGEFHWQAVLTTYAGSTLGLGTSAVEAVSAAAERHKQLFAFSKAVAPELQVSSRKALRKSSSPEDILALEAALGIL